MYTLIFCRFHICFPEDIIGSGNTPAAFHWMGIYMQPNLSSFHKSADPVHIFYIYHLFIYMVYMFTCNTVYMITLYTPHRPWLCLLFMYHHFAYTWLHVYTYTCILLIPIYMLSSHSLGCLIQEHMWIIESSCKHVYHPLY